MKNSNARHSRGQFDPEHKKLRQRAAKMRSQELKATGEAAPLDQWVLRVRDTGRHDPSAGFKCRKCGAQVTWDGAGSAHRNHCPHCLHSLHLDNEPGDRAADCDSIMEPVALWARKKGEWALIHRCTSCGALSSNRIAADDNQALLLSLAVRPLASPPFPLEHLGDRRPRWPFDGSDEERWGQ